MVGRLTLSSKAINPQLDNKQDTIPSSKTFFTGYQCRLSRLYLVPLQQEPVAGKQLLT
ncbi:hypothetical protein M378DRAFT_172430 [Amanita muscaria Koide BX008]|uniref:Uncharacterized protein n=1 Tax=Amanita muscaria (strain Koide BX008) TaxID=946122 RepID=A0A0C2WJ86_AMAMK|nr:hypothetical protein M378DRAFT_172430 [Amanita muscaria Koide BX008]